MKSEHGSAIVYVFIGIALFGALMFLFSRGASQTSPTISAQRAKILATEITDYSTTLEKGVQKLLSKGCSEKEINFASPMWFQIGNAGAYLVYENVNGHSPADHSCQLFRKEGGGVIFQQPPKDAIASPNALYNFTGTMTVLEVGTSFPELNVILEVNKDVCIAVNKLNGVNLPSGQPYNMSPINNVTLYPTPLVTWKAYGYWMMDTLGSAFNTWLVMTSAYGLKGHKSGCFAGGASTITYLYYYVLEAR